MRAGFAVLLVAWVGCRSQAPSADVLERGYDALQRGDLQTASALAETGGRRAPAASDPAWEGRLRVFQAEVLVERGRYPEALALLNRRPSTEPRPSANQIRALITRGRARCLLGSEPDTAWQADLAEAKTLAAGLGSPALACEVAVREGTCAMWRGQVTAAETQLMVGLHSSRSQGLPFLEAIASLNVGLLRVQTRRYDEATSWLRKTLDLALTLKADLLRVKTLTNLGWCYYLVGDYDRALSFHSQAEALAQATGYAKGRQIALQNLGNVHYDRGDLPLAEDAYRRSLLIARELGSRKAIAELLSNLAYVALNQDRYEESTRFLNEALSIKRELDDRPAIQHSLLAEGLLSSRQGNSESAAARFHQVLASSHSDAVIRWTARASLAELAVKAGRPDDAEREYGGAFQIMEASYSELRQAEHRISFFSSLDQFHDDYVDFLVASGRRERALEVADRSRARQLRERLETVGAAKGPPAAASPASVARSLDSIILFYSLAPTRSFLWALTPRGTESRVLPGEAEIRGHVEGHQRRILQARDPLGEESSDASWLYTNLVGPVEKWIPAGSRIVFVPDGALHQLNPETLVVSSPKPHYWIEDVTLVTAPSVSLLATGAGVPGSARPAGSKARRAAGQPRPTSILLIGDPEPAGDEFPRLAQAERELGRIADQFAPAERVLCSGPRAVPSAYAAAEPGRFSFIHFAAHAQASREVPLDSAVILTKEGDTAKLYARDVVKLPLHAELVTLSACRSAGSRTFAGEGLVGLGWAFLSAGAENVVAGLWNVEDASTAELMADLYRGVRHGLAPAEALRAAKLGLLRSQTAYRKPFYWAPFMVYTRNPGPRGSARAGVVAAASARPGAAAN